LGGSVTIDLPTLPVFVTSCSGGLTTSGSTNIQVTTGASTVSAGYVTLTKTTACNWALGGTVDITLPVLPSFIAGCSSLTLGSGNITLINPNGSPLQTSGPASSTLGLASVSCGINVDNISLPICSTYTPIAANATDMPGNITVYNNAGSQLSGSTSSTHGYSSLNIVDTGCGVSITGALRLPPSTNSMDLMYPFKIYQNGSCGGTSYVVRGGAVFVDYVAVTSLIGSDGVLGSGSSGPYSDTIGSTSNSFCYSGTTTWVGLDLSVPGTATITPFTSEPVWNCALIPIGYVDSGGVRQYIANDVFTCSC